MAASETYTPEQVHLVGSIGLGSVEEVFRTVGQVLGRRLMRVPDGEVGGRRLWISWQYPLLRSSPFLMPDPSGAVHRMSQFPILALAEGVRPEEIQFGELGYTREARVSYQDFCAARARGELPANAKFQVSLPTPMAVTYAYVREQDVLAVYDVYERDMLSEVATLCASIPHRDLCLQWDVCQEMLTWDGQPLDMYPTAGATTADILRRMCRLCAAVPADVDLGLHLCYGDFRAKHFLEPRDAGKMVEFANRLFAELPRPLSYIHMPVPIERTDETFFLPFKDLTLPAGTQLFLGLVHAADGLEGTRRRMAVACRFIGGFGIATECGIARARSPQLVRTLLQLHALAANEPPDH